MKKTLLIALGFTAILGAGVAVVQAVNSQNCSGSHCTFVATYVIGNVNNIVATDNDDAGILHVSMSMDVQALPFGITSVAGAEQPFEPGNSFEVPIEASGEIVGHAVQFYDTPPIFFEADGVVRAVTEGLHYCQALRARERAAARQIGFCGGQGFFQGGSDIVGRWQDAWQAYADTGSGQYTQPMMSVQCVTQPSGAAATCTSNGPATGTIRLQLTRTVDNMRLGNNLPEKCYIDFGGTRVCSPDIFPGEMVSSVFVKFEAPVVSSEQCAVNDSKLSCLTSAMSLSQPSLGGSGKGTTIAYWDTLVNYASFSAAAASCGLETLRPDNFTSAGLEALVEAQTSSYRYVGTDGSCSTTGVAAYRNAGHKISDVDLQELSRSGTCTQPRLQYKINYFSNAQRNDAPVDPSTPGAVNIEGIGDGGAQAYAAVICPEPSFPSPTPIITPTPGFDLGGAREID